MIMLQPYSSPYPYISFNKTPNTTKFAMFFFRLSLKNEWQCQIGGRVLCLKLHESSVEELDINISNLISTSSFC